MKKLLCCIIAVLMSISVFAGCGSKEETATNDEATLSQVKQDDSILCYCKSMKMTVSLPSSWTDKYIATSTSTSLNLYNKGCYDNGSGGLLFSICYSENTDFASDSQNAVFDLVKISGKEYYAYVASPKDTQYSDDFKEEYETMLSDKAIIVGSVKYDNSVTFSPIKKSDLSKSSKTSSATTASSKITNSTSSVSSKADSQQSSSSASYSSSSSKQSNSGGSSSSKQSNSGSSSSSKQSNSSSSSSSKPSNSGGSTSSKKDESVSTSNICNIGNMYSSSGYVFPQSSSVKYSASDLKGIDSDTIQFGINEIYAKHGYVFKTKWIREIFESKSWYTPDKNLDLSKAVFSDIEQHNIDVMSKER